MFRSLPLTALLLSACGGPDLLITPTAFHFGGINVQVDRPPDGYDARDLLITNTSTSQVDIQFVGVDLEHLFIAAPIFASTSPLTLPTLAPEDTAIVTIAAWDYELGELTTQITGTFQVLVNGKNSTPIEWSFTPVRQQVEDTASP